jgi:hypothetical protein
VTAVEVLWEDMFAMLYMCCGCADEVFGFSWPVLVFVLESGYYQCGRRTVDVCAVVCAYSFCRALQAFGRKRDASLSSEG